MWEILNSNLDAAIVIDAEGRVIEWSQAAEDLFKFSRAQSVGRRLEDLIVPSRMRDAHVSGLARLRAGGAPRLLGRRVEVEARDANGRSIMVELGLSQVEFEGALIYVARLRDITERLQNQRRATLLNRELHHRVGNALAVITSLIRLTRKSVNLAFYSTPQAERVLVSLSPEDRLSVESAAEDSAARAVGEYARILTARVESTARAHQLLRSGQYQGATLADLIEGEVTVYGGQVIETGGPEVILGPEATQTLGLCLHEMFTNAAKHGALSPVAVDGSVTLKWVYENDDLVLRWNERGGPPPAPAGHRGKGFGSSLIKMGLEADLGGWMQIDYAPEGLNAIVGIPRSNLGADRYTNSGRAPVVLS